MIWLFRFCNWFVCSALISYVYLEQRCVEPNLVYTKLHKSLLERKNKYEKSYKKKFYSRDILLMDQERVAKSKMYRLPLPKCTTQKCKIGLHCVNCPCKRCQLSLGELVLAKSKSVQTSTIRSVQRKSAN